MKVTLIILGLLLTAAIVLIIQQKKISNVQKEFINLCVQRIKDLNSDVASLKQQLEIQHQDDDWSSKDDKTYQGH